MKLVLCVLELSAYALYLSALARPAESALYMHMDVCLLESNDRIKAIVVPLQHTSRYRVFDSCFRASCPRSFARPSGLHLAASAAIVSPKASPLPRKRRHQNAHQHGNAAKMKLLDPKAAFQ
ncbi:hypothetical protein M441DRAFT_268250 [Trichoderma asperellum CBS 433.97]|uniref:Secreted protein n=1 Tax=Trichoderma asperellum (strain ATCC 204424 / CBS 433.97 / NBRC 101777) TaxID=1042311 RepID=A0A2T3YW06_TRIA4|nr:hypothetical protein M441DRAFT_268250 [Trichoderma asperellum CBS 433.97]PTB36710.1 hypothetical protein M441DRAFT_268250 [Trichoderma asperellum CBS 433.97]